MDVFSKNAISLCKSGCFPSPDELGSAQKIFYGHTFFAGLLDRGQMEEAVGKGNFQVFLVVGDNTSDRQTMLAQLHLGSKHLHLDFVASVGTELGMRCGVGRETSYMVVNRQAVIVPWNGAKLLADFWCRFKCNSLT